jgi:hypothetical protein
VEILFSVVWPDDDKADSISKIRGRVSRSSRVRVNGEETPVAPDGSFIARVPVAETQTRVHVEAEDTTGRRKTEDRILRRPSRVPMLEAGGEGLWKE